MSETTLCYVTCPDVETARAMARSLVEERLAAGGNIVPGMMSVYRWKGAVCQAEEVLLILKTRSDTAGGLMSRAVALHPYECPCVALLPIAGGNPDYLKWILAESGTTLDARADTVPG
jgi:periplasmic divalent cation tolerance protein